MKFGSLPAMIRRFRRDQHGNVLMMFGLALVPMMGVVGVAIDYSRASNARQALNAAIDSAALMAARDAQKLTDGEIRARIDAWIKDNLPSDVKSEFTGATVTIDRTARTIKIAAEAKVPTTISRVLGPTELPVSSVSQSTWGTNKIELALVLDNTGSMANSKKMEALKQASKDLIKIMQEAALDADQIKISIVPFNTQVRVDRGLKDEAWIRYGMTRKINCDRYGNNCTTETLTKSVWAQSHGCIADRDQNYDVTDAGSYAANAQQYPATWCSQSSLAEIKPLTSNWSALNAHIDTMTPVGNTNVTIGAVWGWATLSTEAPFTQAKPPTEPQLKKYMILLTDGDNTENRFTTNGSEIDARTSLACTGVKNAGISLYTIRVIDGDATLLKNCATRPDMYYDVKNASELSPIFKAIASEISAVRLTQ